MKTGIPLNIICPTTGDTIIDAIIRILKKRLPVIIYRSRL